MSEELSFWKELQNDHTDCYPCRALSSIVLFTSGYFLYSQRNNFGRINSIVQSVLGCGLITVGILRATGLPPFEMDMMTHRSRELSIAERKQQ